LVAVLETGLRTATYKLATLMALIDHCMEHVPTDPAVPLEVPIRDLAQRVFALYWPQVRALDGVGELRQSTQTRARIIDAVKSVRVSSAAGPTAAPEVARLRNTAAYEAAIDSIMHTLVRQPLPRLQHLPGKTQSPTFLYDDSWMGEGVSLRTIERRGGVVVLYPGVASALARLSGLLRPMLEILWVQDVVRLNAALLDERVDIDAHLFGQQRIGLSRVREALFDEFGPWCFYCGAGLSSSSPVDHVLPWSRVGLDGLANLVAACARCNGSKSNALPEPALVAEALSRGEQVLARIGSGIAWPVQYDRTRNAARGLYLSSPSGTPLWRSRDEFGTVGPDFVWPDSPRIAFER
jgi:5-methylcytosine-specific restriction endonuclease McrA